jgi:hypothetical protein
MTTSFRDIRWRVLGLAAASVLSACGGSAGPDAQVEQQLVGTSAQSISPPFPLPTPTPLPSPRISVAPTDATVGLGAGATFSVSAAGTGTLTYQWFKNGVALAGQTAARLTFAATVASDQARYHVRVRDGGGATLTTAAAQLTLVSNGWAPLGGRAIYAAPSLKQPALALCAQPTVVHLMRSNGRATLYAHWFDGIAWRHFGAGGILNATQTGHASDPSIDCVSDGAVSRPVVAWSEGDAISRNIYVKVFNGTDWVSIGAALNINAGTRAVKPSLRATPLDPNTGNTLHEGLTLRSAVAWIEDGVPSLRQWSMNGWTTLAGGGQVPGGANAKDIALAIDFGEIGRTYPPVVAWLQESNGSQQVYSATHNQGLASWVSMAAPIGDSRGPLPNALLKGRIGVGVGKFQAARQPLVTWVNAGNPNGLLAYMYPTEYYANGTVNQPWDNYGGTSVGSAVETTSFDAREFGVACNAGDLLTFGVAIAYGNRFEVQRGDCKQGLSTVPAEWKVVRAPHNVAVKEIALRMAAENDPVVAGTQLVGDSYQLSIWKFYP